MLAKLWKKVLLAVCIIACLFNITSKLVNRHSLKENLQSVNDGETIFDLSGKDSSSDSGKKGTNGSGNADGANDAGESNISNEENNRANDSNGSNSSNGNSNHVVIYDDDGNIVDEYDVDDNGNIDNSNNDGYYDDNSNDEGDGDNGRGREVNIDVRDAAKKVKDKVSDIDVDVEPVEAPEVYHEVPVYEEGEPQRENANNADYKFTVRDFFGLFKGEENN